MRRNALRHAPLIVLACLALVACQKRRPKMPVPDPAEQVVEDPKPKPKPKCESLDEKCVGEANNRVQIGEAGSFQPPADWVYAKLAEGSVAIAADGKAGIAFAKAEGTEAEKVFAALQGLLTAMEVADVTEASVKKMLKKKPVVEDAEGLKLNTWDTACKVKGAAGMMLLAVAPLDGGGAVVGVVALQKDAAGELGKPARDALLSLRSRK